METWDAIRSRRNVRTYAQRAITREDLDRILEAARRTPSSMNQQRWDFVLATERRQLVELSKVWRDAGHVATSAATIALIAPRSDERHTQQSIQYDLGQATMSIMLAAADAGVGSCHAAVENQALARQVLGIPDGHRVEWLLSIGYPGDRPLAPIERPDRRPFEEVVRFGRW